MRLEGTGGRGGDGGGADHDSDLQYRLSSFSAPCFLSIYQNDRLTGLPSSDPET